VEPVPLAPSAHTRRRVIAGAALIVGLVLAAYAPARRGGFVWDDDAYLTNNPLITAADGLGRIWFSLDAPSQYFPLVYTMFRFEHGLWGMNPLGYHAVNILLHALVALLLWRLLAVLSLPGAWLAAALFAVHPVHVESVAWITERKNLLSTVFLLGSVLTWLRFVAAAPGARRLLWYGSSLGMCALALFSKTTTCTLPLVLLLLGWLKGERVSGRRLLHLAPFTVLAVVMGLVTIWWEQNHQGTSGAEFAFSWPERIIIAGRGFWFYLGKLAFPVNLSFMYPRWSLAAGSLPSYAWPAAAALTGGALWLARASVGRSTIAAGIFYVVSLGPILGFVSLYTFRYTFVADHYQYVASMAPIALVAGVCSRTWLSSAALARQRWLVPAALLVLLGAMTWRQAGSYRDSETLWQQTLVRNPTSWLAWNNLAAIRVKQRDYPEAERLYRRALEINPRSAEVQYNLGLLAVDRRDLAESRQRYRALQQLDPEQADALLKLIGVISRP